MKINHVIRTLVFSDFYINIGLGLFAPVFAIFVTQQIKGASIEVVGFAAAITQIVKVSLEIPIAKYLDKNHGEYDDFYSMVFGSLLISLVPFLYLLATKTVHVYVIQAILGMGTAFTVPPWFAIFSRHLDKLHENIEWSFESIAIGIAAAGSAALGGILAQRFSFNLIFIIGGIFAVLGAVNQCRVFKDLKNKVPRGTVKPEPNKLS